MFAVVPTHFTVIQPDSVVSLIFEGENVESTDAQVSSNAAQVAVVAGPVVCAIASGDSIKTHNAQMIRRIEKMGKVFMSVLPTPRRFRRSRTRTLRRRRARYVPPNHRWSPKSYRAARCREREDGHKAWDG